MFNRSRKALTLLRALARSTSECSSSLNHYYQRDIQSTYDDDDNRTNMRALSFSSSSLVSSFEQKSDTNSNNNIIINNIIINNNNNSSINDENDTAQYNNHSQERARDLNARDEEKNKNKNKKGKGKKSSVSQLKFSELVKPNESPLQLYERLAKENVLQRDSKQLEALKILDKFYERTMNERDSMTTSYNNSSSSSSGEERGRLRRLGRGAESSSSATTKSWFQKLWERTNKSDASVLTGETSAGGVYLYGGPGCGKTFVVDLFVSTLPREFSKRVHFHAFMMETHGELHRLSKKKTDNVSNEDTVKWFADSLASQIDVLCLDEFQVTDVADAMIIRRLLDRLWENNVRVVCTSNRAPDELYKNGLNRVQFLPCIEGIKNRMKVHDMDSLFDYRMIGSVNIHGVWKTIGNENENNNNTNNNNNDNLEKCKKQAHEWLEMKTQNLAGERQLKELEVAISGRSLKIKQAGGGVARIEFDELCNANLGPSDYVALCSTFHAIGIENIPKLSLDRVDLMRRFITFIDVAYEHKVKLIITAYAKHPDDLLVVDKNGFKDARDEFFAWDRAKSRLNEMQTAEYTKSSWQPKTSKWLLEQSFSLREKINVHSLRGLWQRYDVKKNGVLDESELAYLLADLNELKAGHRHVSKDQLDHSLREMTRRRCGSRGDGFVTFDDFCEYGQKGFDKIQLPPNDLELIERKIGVLVPTI